MWVLFVKLAFSECEWAFTELLSWGMDKNYLEPFIFGEISQEFNFCIGESETNIYSVDDGESFFFIDNSTNPSGVFTPL